MKIKIKHPCTVRLDFQPGDTIEVATLTPQVQQLLTSARLDGQFVAEAVRAEDEITEIPDHEELAVSGRGRRRSVTGA